MPLYSNLRRQACKRPRIADVLARSVRFVRVPQKVTRVRRECLGFAREQSRERVFLYEEMTKLMDAKA